MEVTFNKKSWHFKYYSWVLETTNTPKSLCPYFWSMIALIVLSPIVLFFKLIIFLSDLNIDRKYKKINNMTEEEKIKKRKRENKINNGLEYAGKGFLILMALFVVFIIVFGLYSTVKKVGWWETICVIFAIIGFLTTLFLITYVIMEMKLFNKILNSKVIQVPVAMVKAIYTKACPLIKWEDKQIPQVIKN